MRQAVYRAIWLVCGIVIGFGVAHLWPEQSLHATTVDRASRFAMATVPVSLGNNDPLDGAFALDLVTGILHGGVLDRNVGKFASYYYRDLSKDFPIVPGVNERRYCIVPGYGQMPNKGALRRAAAGVIYIGEEISGRINGYAFPFDEDGTPDPVELILIDVFTCAPPKGLSR
jgi:hypothetical protein